MSLPRLAALAASLLLALGRAPSALAGAEPVPNDSSASQSPALQARPAPGEDAVLQIERPPPDLPAMRSIVRPRPYGGEGRPTPGAIAEPPVLSLPGGPLPQAIAQPVPAPPAESASPVATTPLVPMARDRIAAATNDGAVAYVLEDNSRVIVLDMPNVVEQARRFLRIVLFIERGGAPRHRVLTVAEARQWLEGKNEAFATVTVGNNIRASEFARFFNTARFQGEPLTEDEERLLADLKAWDVLMETDHGLVVEGAEKIVITVPQVSTVEGCLHCTIEPPHRRAILEHELAHALFSTDTIYRDHAVWFWHNVMGEATRQKFLAFLASRGYDITNPELVVNEMQAFLMHTPEKAIFSAAALGVRDEELENQRRLFADGLRARRPVRAQNGYRFD